MLVIAYIFFNGYINSNNQNYTNQQIKIPTDLKDKETKEMDLIILKIAHNFPESHPQHIALVEKFAPMVEEGSNWKIRVEIYPNKQLGGEKEYIQGVRNGTIEMCIGGQVLDEVIPKLKILEFPYLFDDYDQVKRVLNGNVGNQITQGMDLLGIYSLTWSLNGFRQVATYEKRIQNNQKKLKLATSFDRINIETLKVMGFDVLPVNINETTMFLKQKIVDGHDNQPLLSYYNGWYENQKNIYITNHIINASMYMVSSKFWNELSNEYKELIKKAAKLSSDYEIELLKRTEQDIFDTLENKGVNIEYLEIYPDKKDIQSIYSQWLNNDHDLIDIFNEIQDEKNNEKK